MDDFWPIGISFVAQSLVVKERIVSIKASSQMVPGTSITHMRANDKAVENGSVWGSPVGCVMDDSPNAPQIYGGVLSARQSNPCRTKTIAIKGFQTCSPNPVSCSLL
ncbi:hypothetical protein NIES25_21670 [Nostoc linckia NIES-25]|nr:hypothetical protein NIES25_21670 [Nostoc linckia NIES-25]